MFGLDLGKMLSGEGGGGLGGMFGGGIMNMVKGQLSSPATRKMITDKVVDMADHLAQKFSLSHDTIRDMRAKCTEEMEALKAAYSIKHGEIAKKYGENPTEEERTLIEKEQKECYAETQEKIMSAYKETESKVNNGIITKFDITLVSKIKTLTSRNEKGDILLLDDGKGSMVEQKENAVYIEIHAKGIVQQELRLDEFLGNMMTDLSED